MKKADAFWVYTPLTAGSLYRLKLYCGMAKTMLLDNSEAKPKAGKLWTKRINKWKGWSEEWATTFFSVFRRIILSDDERIVKTDRGRMQIVSCSLKRFGWMNGGNEDKLYAFDLVRHILSERIECKLCRMLLWYLRKCFYGFDDRCFKETI